MDGWRDSYREREKLGLCERSRRGRRGRKKEESRMGHKGEEIKTAKKGREEKQREKEMGVEEVSR